jgi:integrase
MGRPRKTAKHLPANLLFRHGRYYFVKSGKWHPLSKEYGAALKAYADFVGAPAVIRTVKDAVWAYIEHAGTRTHKKKAAPATLDNYRYSAANLCAVFGAMELGDVDAQMVIRYIIDGGTVQANRDKALLSAAYSHARIYGFKGVDPTKKLQVRNEEKPRERYVEDAEMARLVAAASPKLGTIARFIELTGMRQSDALRVRMADMDDEGIHYQQGKTGKRLVVLWSPELVEVVDQAKVLWRRFGREWLFEGKPRGRHAGRPIGAYTPSGLRALWRKARAKAGLTDVRLHDLRGKAGSDVATEDEAQQLMGHADRKMTRKHYRRRPERVNPVR